MPYNMEIFLERWLSKEKPHSSVLRGFIGGDYSNLRIGYFAVYTPPTLDVEYSVSAAVVICNKLITDPVIYLETEAPPLANCPPYILEVLTPSTDIAVREWRRLCARKNWEYSISEQSASDGQIQLSLTLSNELASQTIKVASAKNKAEYIKLYEEIQSQHLMANIKPLTKKTD